MIMIVAGRGPASKSIAMSHFQHARTVSRILQVSRTPYATVRLASTSPSFPLRSRGALVLLSSVVAVGLSTFLLLERPPVHREAAQGFGLSDESTVRIEPSTSQPLPVILPPPVTELPPSCRHLHLVGLGVRTVSFLRVKVYVAGLYVDSNALAKLHKVPGWQNLQKEWFTSGKGVESGEQLLAALIDEGVSFAIRIVPVRSTDFNHLRDGFTRAIQGRAKTARKEKKLKESSDEALSQSLQSLKDSFPRASLPKGQPLDLLFLPSKSGVGHDLILEEGGKILGHVKSPGGLEESKFGVARQLLLAYMADKNEISKPFKESVAGGFEAAVGSAR